MPTASDTYIYCDDLDNIPKLNKDNYLFELELLKDKLVLNSSILQIGSKANLQADFIEGDITNPPMLGCMIMFCA